MARFVLKYGAITRVGLLLFGIRLLLRMKSLPQVAEMLTPAFTAGTREASSLEDLVYYVDRWLELFPYNAKGNCFPRALAVYWLARRSGCPVYFHCGVRKEISKLDGHAWLTLEDRPFHETSEQWRQFVVTFSYPSDPSQAKEREGAALGRDTRVMSS